MATKTQHDVNSTSIDTELININTKIQNRKKRICRGIALCLTLIFIVFIGVIIYTVSNRGACGDEACGDESLMSPKQHGTCTQTVQNPLRWNCNRDTADRICCFNRDSAENSGYWQTTTFLQEVDEQNTTTFYDSVTGKPLFIAPKGRSFKEFKEESVHHGWPSFRDEEVVWENVRCLRDGECVSMNGTHL
eukprot:339224_1